MALGAKVSKSIHLMVSGRLASADAHARVAALAQERLAAVIASGQGSMSYKRIVDGVENAPESAVKLDGGNITYVFQKPTGDAITFALKYAKMNSPNSGGPYSLAWFIAVNGFPWTKPIADIPPGSTVMLINFAPFARRLEEAGRTHKRGGRSSGTNPSRMVSEMTRRATIAAFPNVNVQREFVAIPGGAGAQAFGWEIPYTLRTGQSRGQAVLYPAVVIRT
jgi:hypothetical protein